MKATGNVRGDLWTEYEELPLNYAPGRFWIRKDGLWLVQHPENTKKEYLPAHVCIMRDQEVLETITSINNTSVMEMVTTAEGISRIFDYVDKKWMFSEDDRRKLEEEAEHPLFGD